MLVHCLLYARVPYTQVQAGRFCDGVYTLLWAVHTRTDSETTVAVTRTAVDPRVPWINRHNDIDVVMLGTRSSLTSNGADSSNSELKRVNVGLDRPATDHDILPSIQFGGVHLTIAAF